MSLSETENWFLSYPSGKQMIKKKRRWLSKRNQRMNKTVAKNKNKQTKTNAESMFVKPFWSFHFPFFTSVFFSFFFSFQSRIFSDLFLSSVIMSSSLMMISFYTFHPWFLMFSELSDLHNGLFESYHFCEGNHWNFWCTHSLILLQSCQLNFNTVDFA